MNAIAERYRGEVIEQLKWAGPLVTEQVLLHVATVPYRGDDGLYIREASAALSDALTAALQPILDAMKAEATAARAKADALEAQHKRWLREFEEFRKMKTPTTVQ